MTKQTKNERKPRRAGEAPIPPEKMPDFMYNYTLEELQRLAAGGDPVGWKNAFARGAGSKGA